MDASTIYYCVNVLFAAATAAVALAGALLAVHHAGQPDDAQYRNAPPQAE